MLKNDRKIIYEILSIVMTVIIIGIALINFNFSNYISKLIKGENNDNKALTESSDYNWNIEDLPYNNKFADLKFSVTENNKTSWSIALDENGDIWTWGENGAGQLGDGSYSSQKLPKKLTIDAKFTQISQGRNFWTALDTNGNIWGCGTNMYGEMGNRYEYKDTDSSNKYAYAVSKPIQITSGTEFKKVVSGGATTLALDKAGNIWGWGVNESGVLMNEGKGNCSRALQYYQNVPLQISNGTKYIDIEINSRGWSAGAIDEDNNLYMWGSNKYGQLAASSDTYTYEDTLAAESGISASIIGSYNIIKIKDGTKFSKLQIGTTGVIALDIDGNLWTWGPNIVNVSDGKKATDIYYYNDVFYAKFENSYNGYYMASGNNSTGYLGTGNTNSYSGLTHMFIFDDMGDNKDYNIIGRGLAIDEEGYMWRWGFDYTDDKGNTVTALNPIQITYEKVEYTVTFKDGTERTEIQTINKGENATAPNWTKPGYTLTWDISFENVTSDLTVNAIWTARNDIPYTVEQYRQNVSLDDYELLESYTYYGTTGTTVQASYTGIEGFKVDTNNTRNKLSGVVAGNGSLVLKIYYDREIYNIKLNTNEGIINGETVTSYIYGTNTTLPTNIAKQGYTFVGWYNNENLEGTPVTAIPNTATGNKTYYAKWERDTFTVTFKDGTERTDVQTVNSGESATPPNWTKPGYDLSWNEDITNITSDLEVEAIWTERNDTPYTVEHHLQNINKTEYIIDNTATESKTGTTRQQTNAVAKAYTGFTAQPFEQTTIRGEGNTVVVIYYNRNTYSITLDPGEGTLPAGSETIEYTYGEEITLPEPTRPGYDFAGWYDDEGNRVEKITTTDNGDKELIAQWTARTDTSYKVVHHFRNLDSEVEGYNEEEEQKTGTTDTQVIAEYKEREGFTKNEADTRTVKQGTIAGDGSLVLHLYYTRNTYNIEYELNGGTVTSPLTNSYTYGKEMILQTNRVTRAGYEFAGWYDNEELSGNSVTSIPNTATGDKTFYAKWTKNIFTVTFKDGTERTETQTINRGESATPPNWTKPGYDLSWSEDITNITSDLTVNAIWAARTDTAYKIVHHFRNLDTEVEGYNEEEETKTGVTDTVVTAEYKTVEGFTKNENDPRTVKQGTVAGDGSLVLHLYYNRNTYNITYELNGGTSISSLTNKYIYGKEMILQTKIVTKQGYVFAGWYDNEELTGSLITIIPNTATGDKTFYAKWVEAEKEYYILSEVYSIDLIENTITKVNPETNVSNFLSKIETNGTCKVLNLKGEEVTGNALVGTGYKLQVTFKGENYTYEIAVRGDLDGNGKITTTDLSIINQQILHKIELTGIKAKAADTDYNGKLTTTDLSMINQAVLRKITL